MQLRENVGHTINRERILLKHSVVKEKERERVKEGVDLGESKRIMFFLRT